LITFVNQHFPESPFRAGVKIQGNVDLRINLILLLNNYEISSIKKLLHPK